MNMMSKFAAALLLLWAHACTQAADMPNHPFVTSSGKAQLWMQPNIGELRFETGTQHASAEIAASQLQELSAAILQALAAHGVAPGDIESHEFSKKAVPVNGSQEMAYSIGRSFRVQVRDLAQWPSLMDAVLAMDHVDTVSASFDRTDSDDINRELMSAAASDARSKAAQLAQAFGRKLGPAVAIARGPLDKVSAPFVAQHPGASDSGTAAVSGRSTVPPSIPYAQSVNAIFALK